MRFDDYQQGARRTAIYADRHRVIYPALGLASEAGEVSCSHSRQSRAACARASRSSAVMSSAA